MEIIFHKFHKIHNLESKLDNLKNISNNEWVVTEKIHGCNLSILTNGREVKVARRSALLCASEYKTFYNVQYVLKDTLPIAQQIHIDLNLKEQLIIYGELFGGGYPNEKAHGYTKLVQRGIYYHPNIKFCVFDIRIGNKYLDFNNCMKICERYGLMFTRPLFRGNIEDRTNWSKNNKHAISTIPKIFGIKDIENFFNLREGHIIRPIKSEYFLNGEFVIVKDKNNKFSDISSPPDKFFKQENFNELLEHQLYDEIISYINLQRLENVVSKIGDIEILRLNKAKY